MGCMLAAFGEQVDPFKQFSWTNQMDFDIDLRSPSMRDQCRATLLSFGEGAYGAKHLPALLQI
jgi:hypothetical protein